MIRATEGGGKKSWSVLRNIMELKWSPSTYRSLLLTGFTLLLVLVNRPAQAVEIHADPEVIFENGTSGVLRCSFRSSEVVSSSTSVTWTFQSSSPDNEFSKVPNVIFYYFNGRGFPGHALFKERVKFIGDINKKDASIQLNPAHMSDNGTFFCDVKNPPDVTGTQGRTEVRVVLKEALPQSNTAMIVGAVCAVLLVLVLIAAGACVVMRVMHNRHEYEGCTSLESVSSQAPQPRKKAESSLEGSRSTSPSGPVQVGAGGPRPGGGRSDKGGPVIYAQLDHSGSKNSFHKMDTVVYADIRKN